MPDNELTSAETPPAALGFIVDKATGQVVGRIHMNKKENDQPENDPNDKTRAGQLARAAAIGRVRAHWEKRDYNRFQNRLSQERRDKDAAALQKAFAEAADIPIFKEALDWAREHGIDFFVDRTCTKQVGAYYTGGIGAVGVNFRVLKNPQLMAIYLTHEIRHAFQDVHGLLGHSMKPDYAGQAIRTALVEADAMAFETLAAHQAARATLRKRQAENGLPPDLAIRLQRVDKYCSDEKADLWRGFRNWFETQRPYYYSDAVAKREAAMLGMPGVIPPDNKYEFQVLIAPRGPQKVIDITDDAQFQKLGKTFSGENYLNEQRRREFVLHTVNSPSLSRSFWRANAKPPKLIVALRKRELQMKTAEPSLNISTYGCEGDIAALKEFLGQCFAKVAGVKSITHKATSAVTLDAVVTFKRGTDAMSAFSAAATQLDGHWASAAPTVGVLFLSGRSGGVVIASGRLERNSWRSRKAGM